MSNNKKETNKMTINVTDTTPNVVTLRLTQFYDGFGTVIVTEGWE